MPSPETVWESNRHDNPGRLLAQTPRKPSASHFRTEEIMGLIWRIQMWSL
jgi:hypothetical protein